LKSIVSNGAKRKKASHAVLVTEIFNLPDVVADYLHNSSNIRFFLSS